MKLIRCNDCKDVVALRLEDRTCICGKSGGVYHEDQWNVTVYGPCIVIGMDNFTFGFARQNRYDPNDESRTFKAWVFKEPFIRIHRKEQ